MRYTSDNLKRKIRLTGRGDGYARYYNPANRTAYTRTYGTKLHYGAFERTDSHASLLRTEWAQKDVGLRMFIIHHFSTTSARGRDSLYRIYAGTVM